ncbi:hypothetical protein [Nonomuraea sp. NPDC003754]
MRTVTIPVLAGALTGALALALAATPAVTTPAMAGPAAATPRPWAVTWGTAAQPATASTSWYGSNWSQEGFAGQTLRQVIRVSAGGTSVRVKLSNLYGTRPLTVDGAAITRAGPPLPNMSPAAR